MAHEAKPGHHGHRHDHRHAHGHAHDRGWTGFLRYALNFRRMWTSEVSAAVVALVAPRAGERVLEIGSGMGAAMVVAAQTGAAILVTDPTPYMRRILRLRSLVQKGRARISIAEGAAESLPARDASVDAVWSVNTMHHWGDTDRALAEIRRVLKPGGRLLLVDEDFDAPSHPDHEHLRARRSRHKPHFATVDPAAWAEKLRALGFSSASGQVETIAGRPAKVVRGQKG